MTVKELRDIVNSIPQSQDENVVVLDARDSFGFYELEEVYTGSIYPVDGFGKQTYFFDPYSNEICNYDSVEFKTYDDFIKHVSQYPDQLFPCVVLLP